VLELLQTAFMAPMLLPDFLDPEKILSAAGPWVLWVVALIVFAECGLFSLLPGDSLLFTVGMFVALGHVSYGGSHLTTMVLVCGVLIAAAILGNITGYYLGRLIGPPLFKPRTGLPGKVFDPIYVDKTHRFFRKYGPKALVIARFVPMVRTFVTLVAGVARMDFRTFIKWTAIGGVLWVIGVTVLGYFLGQVPFVHDNLEVAILLIVFISILPMIFEYIMAKKHAKATAEV
jgi:membrane-associated protein